MEFVTWTTLGTYAGCLAMVLVITQFTKKLPFVSKIPTQLWSFVLAMLVLNLANYFTTGETMSSITLSVFNAIVISLAANGGFTSLNKAFPSLFSTSSSSS